MLKTLSYLFVIIVTILNAEIVSASSEEKPLTIVIQLQDASFFEINTLNAQNTISNLKSAIEQQRGIPTAQQELSRNGIIYNNGDTIQKMLDYYMDEFMTIIYQLRLKGVA